MMPCEHASTTALLHLFGEAPPGYAEHLAGCPDCQDTLAEHADTVARIAPAPRVRPATWLLGAAAALAAGLALTLLPAPPPAPNGAAPDLTWEDPLSLRIDQLDAEIDTLALQLETL